MSTSILSMDSGAIPSRIPAIGFNMAEFYDHIKAGNPIDVCYSIVENFYRGSSTLQLRLKDMRERDELI